MLVHWSRHNDEWYCNVEGIGQYRVKKVHRSGTWTAIRNGEPTAMHEDSLGAIKKAVENVIRAVKECK